jgi:hypothetical protein
VNYKAWWSLDGWTISSPDQAQEVIEEATSRIYPHGGCGIIIRIGQTTDEQAPLRIAIDVEAGRAAVFWHDTPGVEPSLAADQELTVGDDPYSPPLTVPAEQARVTPATAIRAAREYVDTGQQPKCLSWDG